MAHGVPAALLAVATLSGPYQERGHLIWNVELTWNMEPGTRNRGV